MSFFITDIKEKEHKFLFDVTLTLTLTSIFNVKDIQIPSFHQIHYENLIIPTYF